MKDPSQPTSQPSSPPPLPAGPAHRHPYPQPEIRRGVSPLLVILICLLLGMALAWGYGGERATWHMANSLNQTKTHLTTIRSNQSDLMAMLADPATRIIPLRASKSAGEATAVVVLDPTAGRGMLLCRQLWILPRGQAYHLNANADQGTLELASFVPSRGVTAVPFHVPDTDSLTSFELWAGAPGTAASPLFTVPRS